MSDTKDRNQSSPPTIRAMPSPSSQSPSKQSTQLKTPTTTTRTTNPQSRTAQLTFQITKTQSEITSVQARLDEACTLVEQQRASRVATRSIEAAGGSGGGDRGSVDKSTSNDNTISDGTINHDTTIKDAKLVVEQHIKLLTKYNETKDVAMSLLGMIAEREGRRLVDVMERRRVEDCE